MHENTREQALHGGSRCWCGNTTLEPFSTAYLYCSLCQTLVAQEWPEQEWPEQDVTHVVDDGRDFYGKNYWFAHQESDLGLPNVVARARLDLAERCVYWLHTLLQYKLPPAQVLELGSAHGGFVALLRWAGFEAMGLEMSPWMVDFARQTFAVPILQGPLEEQHIVPGTLDVIALMDVLEHLPDPVGTIQHCLRLLKPDGLLVIQTPCFPAGKTYAEMVAQEDRFLEMLREKGHLYLFSQRSIREFFSRLGANYLEFKPALFAHYDMFLVVSCTPPVVRPPEAQSSALSATAGGRMIQALLDADDQQRELQQRYAVAEADRVARQAVIEQQGHEISQLQAQVHHWLQEHQDLYQQLLGAIACREEEIAVLQAQVHHWLQQNQSLHQQCEAVQQESQSLRQHLEAAEADRAARLLVIEQQGEEIVRLRRVVEAMQEKVQQVLQILEHTRVYRLLRRLGRWKFMEQMLPELWPGAAEHTGDQPSLPLTPPLPPQADEQPLGFDLYYAQVRAPKEREGVAYTPAAEERIAQQLRLLGQQVSDYEIDVEDYRRYFAAARYAEDFPHYYPTNLPEKSLEHYIATQLLQLNAQDIYIYIDIASEHSPVPDIYRHLFATTTYRQDLAYPPGLHADKIGGDAAHMPLPEAFATKMALHCSFEHFEGDSDIGFIRETARVLRPGGAACIIPFYLFEEYAIQTDPVVALPAGVVFDDGATVYCAQGWNNRYGRFYSPEQFVSRVCKNASDLHIIIYRVTNAQQVDPSCYVRFAMLLKKPE